MLKGQYLKGNTLRAILKGHLLELTNILFPLATVSLHRLIDFEFVQYCSIFISQSGRQIFGLTCIWCDTLGKDFGIEEIGFSYKYVNMCYIIYYTANMSEIFFYLSIYLSNTIHMCSGITSGRVLNGELLYTKILEVKFVCICLQTVS